MVRSSPSERSPAGHIGFPFVFIGSGLAIGVFGGFLIGGYFAAAIALSLPLGNGFPAFLQIHGHLQLVGWVGLFVMGISLYFIPRFSSIPIRYPAWIHPVLAVLVAGLLLRTVGQGLLPFTGGSRVAAVLRILTAGSGCLEFLGVAGYVMVLAGTVRSLRRTGTRPTPLETVRPFFLMMLSGWILFAFLQMVLTLGLARSGAAVLNQGWNEVGYQVFLLLVLLPVAFAFSIRTFPIFLGTPVPAWPIRTLAFVYLAAVLMQLGPQVLDLLGWPGPAGYRIPESGALLKGGVIFYLVARIGILSPSVFIGNRDAWRSGRSPQPYKYSRIHGPDEFGRFDLLVVSAYVWLAFGAAMECLGVLSGWAGLDFGVGSDPVRHAYLLGFVTLLILGMAVRMIPGFTGTTLASTRLVGATFWLGNAAAACRILPLLIPEFLLTRIPAAGPAVRLVFASSGGFGIAAVACLGINLLRTGHSLPGTTRPGDGRANPAQ